MPQRFHNTLWDGELQTRHNGQLTVDLFQNGKGLLDILHHQLDIISERMHGGIRKETLYPTQEDVNNQSEQYRR